MRKYEWKGSGIVVRMFRTSDGAIHEIQEPQDGCWIALTNPTATEIFEISEQFQIEVDDLRAPLDEEERSRIEVEDTYTLILVDVPMIEERNDKDWYGTIPLGIIVTDKMIFTICLEDTQVLTRFMEGRVRNFFTYMKTRFILQILYRKTCVLSKPHNISACSCHVNCWYITHNTSLLNFSSHLHCYNCGRFLLHKNEFKNTKKTPIYMNISIILT